MPSDGVLTIAVDANNSVLQESFSGRQWSGTWNYKKKKDKAKRNNFNGILVYWHHPEAYSTVFALLKDVLNKNSL